MGIGLVVTTCVLMKTQNPALSSSARIDTSGVATCSLVAVYALLAAAQNLFLAFGDLECRLHIKLIQLHVLQRGYRADHPHVCEPIGGRKRL